MCTDMSWKILKSVSVSVRVTVCSVAMMSTLVAWVSRGFVEMQCVLQCVAVCCSVY